MRWAPPESPCCDGARRDSARAHRYPRPMVRPPRATTTVAGRAREGSTAPASCSVYRLNGVGLDRDADQQALEGRLADTPIPGVGRLTARRKVPAAEAIDVRTDRELVVATRAGEVRAFDALFYRYRDGIFRVGLAITKDPSHAEEIVVDTFARAFRAIERLEPDDSLRPWTTRSPRRACARRAARRRACARASPGRGRSRPAAAGMRSACWGASVRPRSRSG